MPFSITGTQWVHWEGLDEAKEMFDALGDTTNVMASLITMADQIVQEQQNLAPVDTGFMRDETAVTEVGDDSVRIEAQANYSGFVEFGTTKMEPQPWFYPPVEALDATTITDDVFTNWGDTIAKFNPFRGGFKSIGQQLLT